jgi:uridine kinase
MSSLGEPIEVHPKSTSLARAICKHLPWSKLAGKVIAVGGESASGKSTTALALKQHLNAEGQPVVLLHMDGYFHLAPKENHEQRKASLDHVGLNEIDLPLLQHHIDQFREGRTQIEVPQVDYLRNMIETKPVPIPKGAVLLIEGTYALYLKSMDFGIFMARTYNESKIIRMNRTREQYDPFVESVLEIEHQLVCESQRNAQLWISSDFAIQRTKTMG